MSGHTLGWLMTFCGMLSGLGWAQDYGGTFVTHGDRGTVTLTLRRSGEDLAGTLTGGGSHFTLEGYVYDDGAAGSVYGGDAPLGFEIYLQGDTLGLYVFDLDPYGNALTESVSEIILSRQVTARSTVRQDAVGQGAAGPPGVRHSDDAVIASGRGTDLTQDDADAFIEAFEFSLAQVGYAYDFTEAERHQLLAALVQAYPQATAEDQQILSRAREIWSETHARWPSLGDSDRKAFLLAVFVLAFGEATVQRWVGPAGRGGQGGDLGGGSGGSDCTSFEDCTSRFVDADTWSDTFNTQSCWASAGCGGFDASTDTFNYDTP